MISSATRRRVFLLQDIVPNYRIPVFRRLAALDGIDLTVFYSRPSAEMAEEGLRNAVDLTGFRAVELPLWEAGSHAWQPGILRQILMGRPDVLIAGQAGRLDTLLALVLARCLGIRVLWFLGGVPYMSEERIRAYSSRGRIRRLFRGNDPRDRMIRKADGVIAYTRHAARFFASRGFPAALIWVAPNSPDTEALQAYQAEWLARPAELAADRRRFSPGGEKVLFLLGRLNKARHADDLLRAVARLSKRGIRCSLVIVGDGSERAALEAMAADLGLHQVFFLGGIYDERELCRLFLVSDVFVTPGVASLAIKMAMALGRPVVTVDYGLEVHDVEDGVNGLVFPMGDDGALADCLERVIGSEALMQRMAEEGLRTIRERVNIANMIEGFRRAIYEERDIDATS